MHTAVRWTLISAGWLVWGLFNASRLRIQIPDSNWPMVLDYAMPDAIVWAILTPLVVFLARRFPVHPDNLASRLPLHLAFAFLLAVLHTTLDASQNFIFGTSLSFEALFSKIFRHTVHLNVLVYVVIVTLYQYLRHYWKTREEERNNARLREQLSAARLASLEAQLRPHFLFNTLHTISGLMETDPRAGRQVVCRLSELLRASLQSGEQHEVSVERELDHVRAYLEIERIRFAGRLETNVRSDAETLGCAVPSFILQPIVENDIRHGVSDCSEPASVDVSATCRNGHVELCVRDSGPGPRGDTGSGIGLSNTRARLRELYGDEGRIELGCGDRGGAVVTITLPRREAT